MTQLSSDCPHDAGGLVVVGGGMAGMTAALEAAETGMNVTLLEKTAFLGGRVARMARYFPKLCPPNCGLEINFRRIRQNPRIRCLTLAEVTALEGESGALELTVKTQPRFVTDRCTLCGDCLAQCPVDRKSDLDQGMSHTRAIYRPPTIAMPHLMAIDAAACPGKSCSKCVPVCRYGAIDLTMAATETKLRANAVIVAIGWHPYDASRLDGLGFGKFRNVITNTMMERLAAPDGPTSGQVLRPSDGRPPKHVTFVQCAGSRDDSHLRHCSAVCCLASLKQTTYVLDQNKEAKVRVFYIDLRTPGRNERFATGVTGRPGVEMVRGKVARIEELPDSGNLVVHAEDTDIGHRVRQETELVVLATGMVPNGSAGKALGLTPDCAGFLVSNPEKGVYVAGSVARPSDVVATVEDATGAALRAIQCCTRRPAHG